MPSRHTCGEFAGMTLRIDSRCCWKAARPGDILLRRKPIGVAREGARDEDTHACRLVTVSLAAGAAPAMAQDPSGTWLSQSGDTRVRIARCGSSYCGTIVAVRNNLKDESNPTRPCVPAAWWACR